MAMLPGQASPNFVVLRLRRRYAPPLSVIFPGKTRRLSGGRRTWRCSRDKHAKQADAKSLPCQPVQELSCTRT